MYFCPKEKKTTNNIEFQYCDRLTSLVIFQLVFFSYITCLLISLFNSNNYWFLICIYISLSHNIRCNINIVNYCEKQRNKKKINYVTVYIGIANRNEKSMPKCMSRMFYLMFFFLHLLLLLLVVEIWKWAQKIPQINKLN